MIEAIAPDKSTVHCWHWRAARRDSEDGSTYTRVDFSCRIGSHLPGAADVVPQVSATKPAELVKKVMVELIKHREKLGLPPLEPPAKPRAPKPTRKRVAYRQPLLSYQR